MARLGLIIGGSTVLGSSTTTSDIDYFLIGSRDELDCTGRTLLHNSDVECRTYKWFKTKCEGIENFEVRIDGKHPDIDYWDLRFLSRVAIGITIISDHEIDALLTGLKHTIIKPTNQFISASFINKYEDLYGLYNCHRVQEFYLEILDLFKLAMQLATLQHNVIELNSKWAYFQAKKLDNTRIHTLIDEFMRVYFDEGRNTAGMSKLLTYSKRIVISSSKLLKNESLLKDLERPNEICPFGLVDYNVAINLITRDVMAY